jgi:hypothetical protein
MAGMPTCSDTPGPVYGSEPSSCAGGGGGAITTFSFLGGSKACAGCHPLLRERREPVSLATRDITLIGDEV